MSLFKPGDRVRVIKRDIPGGGCGCAPHGATGTVAHIGDLVGVQWDQPFEFCHSLSGRLPTRDGYRVHEWMIELLHENLTPFQERVRSYIDKELRDV